jgi:hypothetical protein
VVLVALLLASTTINYIDRQVLSVLAPVLRDEFKLSNAQYAAILNAFLITYIFSYTFGGGLSIGWGGPGADVVDGVVVGRGYVDGAVTRSDEHGFFPRSARNRGGRRVAGVREGGGHGCRPMLAPWRSECATAAPAWAP